MLRDIVKLTQLDPRFCASLFGVAPEQFLEWMAGSRAMPRFLLPEVASVFGVNPADVTEDRPQRDREFAPAIWYKVRSQGQFSVADLEIVGLIRKLCFSFGELQGFLDRGPGMGKAAFDRVRSGVNQSSSVRAQARVAADIFRAEFHWEHGAAGVGDLIRPNLRNAGLVIVESPVSDSRIEGCSFRLKNEQDIPCIFVNSYQSTWFRRNAVILHEVCHSIFDLESDPVSIDYKNETSDELKERRANLFAQECLVPNSVLAHLTSSLGVKWGQLTTEMLAKMIAACHVEQKLLLSAAMDARLITTDQYDRYSLYECTPLLKQFTLHALTKSEFFKNHHPKEEHHWLFEDRLVKIGSRSILLPAGYLKTIIDLHNKGRITDERAAELTMMNRYDFRERFGSLLQESE